MNDDVLEKQLMSMRPGAIVRCDSAVDAGIYGAMAQRQLGMMKEAIATIPKSRRVLMID